MLFSERYKIIVNKFTFVGFTGVSASAETRVTSVIRYEVFFGIECLCNFPIMR